MVTSRAATIDLDAAYASCARDARGHYENFPVASLLVPRDMRRDVAAVYAFARAADDFADEGNRSVEERHRLLDGWLQRLHHAASSDEEGLEPRPGEPPNAVAIFRALGASIRARELPVTLFEDLLSAFRQDVTATRYDDWPDLLDYCRRSANPVGRLVLRIAGYRDSQLDTWSDAVCTALQLTNFWQDLSVDLARGRSYLPESLPPDRLRQGYGGPPKLHAKAEAGSHNENVMAALAAAIRRTRALFAAGRPVCDAVRGRLRYELRATWLGGVRVLEHVERLKLDVIHRRPALGPARRALARCAAADLVTRAMSRDTSFYYSFLVLPPRKRTAMIAVWDFCRAVDDAVDENDAPDRAAVDVAAWRTELAALFVDAPPRTWQGRALQPFVREFNLPRGPFEELIDGVEMDLAHARYPTFDALAEYCRRVAASVGLICVEIFGYSDPRTRSYAVNLGMALQLTNIVRDVAADLRHGRIYLPGEDLARFGVTEDDLRAGQVTPAVKALLKFECTRARKYYCSRRRRSAGSRRVQPDGRGDHGPDLLRDPAAYRARRVRRVQPPHPRPASVPRRHRPAHLGAHAAPDAALRPRHRPATVAGSRQRAAGSVPAETKG